MMNDFTKDELQALLRSWKGDECLLSLSEIYELERKIRSMIDNYCEHPERTYHRKTGRRICPHCDDYFGDNADEIENRLLGYLNE